MSQKAILKKYAQEQGFRNIQFFVDDGYSGANFNRPDWKRMIELVENDKVGVIIAKDNDWLRDSNHHHYLKSFEPDQKPDSLDITISGDGGTNVSLYEAITDMSCVDPEEFVIHSALLGLLPVALSSISKTLRETIVLKYFKYPGKSDEEIAELIGVTKDNFKKNRQRALKELKSFFEK